MMNEEKDNYTQYLQKEIFEAFCCMCGESEWTECIAKHMKNGLSMKEAAEKCKKEVKGYEPSKPYGYGPEKSEGESTLTILPQEEKPLGGPKADQIKESVRAFLNAGKEHWKKESDEK